MLNVARLRVLREVAHAGSISAAASSLDYTQSAVSQQIAALEADLGTALLRRRPVTVTEAGANAVARSRAATLTAVLPGRRPAARDRRTRRRR